MTCYYHQDREAAANCPRCGKTLCRECASKNAGGYCDYCVEFISDEQDQQKKNEMGAELKSFLTQLAISAVLAVGFFQGLSYSGDKDLGTWLMAIWFSLLPFGFHLLTELGGKWDLLIFVSPLFIWLKIIAAAFIGPVAFVAALIGLIKTFAGTNMNSYIQEQTGVNVIDGAKKLGATAKKVSAGAGKVVAESSRKAQRAIADGSQRAREAYDSHRAQRTERAQSREVPSFNLGLDDMTARPQINLSQCIRPQVTVVDGDKKLGFIVDGQAFVDQLGEARNQYRDRVDALRALLESVRPQASKTEHFQSGDTVIVCVDYDWELAEELGLQMTGTQYRMTAK